MTSAEGYNLVVFYYLSPFEIWPDKKGSLWWEWPYKRVGLWWEWPDKKGSLWWESPDKKGSLWWEWPDKRAGFLFKLIMLRTIVLKAVFLISHSLFT